MTKAHERSRTEGAGLRSRPSHSARPGGDVRPGGTAGRSRAARAPGRLCPERAPARQPGAVAPGDQRARRGEPARPARRRADPAHAARRRGASLRRAGPRAPLGGAMETARVSAPPTLRTARLTLGPLESRDAEALVTLAGAFEI